MATPQAVTARFLGITAASAVLLCGTAVYLLRVPPHEARVYTPAVFTPTFGAILLTALAAGVATWRSAHHWRRTGPSTRWLIYSIVVPSIALAWILPHGLLFPYETMLSQHEVDSGWCRLYGAAVPPAVLILATAIRGYRLALGQRAMRPFAIYGIAVGSSLFGDPYRLFDWLLLFLTVIPVLYLMAPAARRARLALERATDALPRASLVR